MTKPSTATVNYPIAASGGNWPPASVWTDMDEQGCYTFTLTATDATCNTSTPIPWAVIKDTVAPVFNPASYYTQGTPCYNDIAGDPNRGNTRLDAELNMNVDAFTSCQTGGFTLTFTMGANTYTPTLAPGAIVGYPSTSQADTLWTFITDNEDDDYSGNVTVNWSLKDCLGNETTGSFVFCVDFAPPDNSFTVFDARPTYGGVWLKWAWGYDAYDATAMEIYRKGEGDYPYYDNDLYLSEGNYAHDHAILCRLDACGVAERPEQHVCALHGWRQCTSC